MPKFLSRLGKSTHIVIHTHTFDIMTTSAQRAAAVKIEKEKRHLIFSYFKSSRKKVLSVFSLLAQRVKYGHILILNNKVEKRFLLQNENMAYLSLRAKIDKTWDTLFNQNFTPS